MALRSVALALAGLLLALAACERKGAPLPAPPGDTRAQSARFQGLDRGADAGVRSKRLPEDRIRVERAPPVRDRLWPRPQKPDATQRARGGEVRIVRPESSPEDDARPQADAPIFSREGGFCRDTVRVYLTCPMPGSAVRYTVDGRPPGEADRAAEGPIEIRRTTCLRARTYRAGFKPSATVTRSYIFLDQVATQGPPPGFPSEWGDGAFADCEMDPEVLRRLPLQDSAGAPFGLEDALRAIPSLSLVVAPDDLFGREGIHANTSMTGADWERPASLEWIDPKGGPGFHGGCGVRIHGGWSRDPRFKKHSFRLYFRKRYGPAALEFPLFPDSRVQRFEKLILRAGSDDAWVDYQKAWLRTMTQYLRDQFARDTHRDMGWLASHGRFVHLYLDGAYWGLYNVVERLDADFLASHLGGSAEDYDVIQTGAEVQDGDGAGWDEALALAEGGLFGAAAFGALVKLVDIDSLADYCLLNFYLGNVDWPHNNWVAGRRRAGASGFRFYSWDAEEILYHPPNPIFDVRVDITGADAAGSPGRLYARLRESAEFRLRFADRAQRHLSDGGPLTPGAVTARWMARAAEIDRAIVAESARWGDLHREPAYTRDDWLKEQQYLLSRYFTVEGGPNRSEILLEQLRSAGLYPDVPAPAFDRPGGKVAPGSTLAMTVPGSGLRYWQLVRAGAACRVLVPAGGSPGMEWTLEDFDDKRWIRGATGVGYERGSGYEGLIRTDVGDRLTERRQSAYLRIPFQVRSDQTIAALRLRIQYDDGFVAYINGVEAARRNAPAALAWSSMATRDHDADRVETIDLADSLRGAVHAGRNVLAIQGLNRDNKASSDFLILPILEGGSPAGPGTGPAIHYTLDGSDPRLPGGTVAPAARRYEAPLVLSKSVTVKARARRDDVWSALREAEFIAPAAAGAASGGAAEPPVDGSPAGASDGSGDGPPDGMAEGSSPGKAVPAADRGGDRAVEGAAEPGAEPGAEGTVPPGSK